MTSYRNAYPWAGGGSGSTGWGNWASGHYNKRHKHHSGTPGAPGTTARPSQVNKLPPDTGAQSAVHFTHSLVGSLTIETGLDTAQWGYNLNTQVYPTYGGEVVQILSVFIDDLQVGGTVSTYSQMEAIYSYFATYMQIATQGKSSGVPSPGVSAYNLEPIVFQYPAREWTFEVIPKQMPGFYYGADVVAPTWQMTAHIVDDSMDGNYVLTDIKTQIADAAVAAGLTTFNKLNDEISPDMQDPNKMAFMAFTGDQGKAITNYSDYYNSLVASYSQNDYSTIMGSGPVNSPPAGNTPPTTSGKSKSTSKTKSKTPSKGTSLGSSGGIGGKGNAAGSIIKW